MCILRQVYELIYLPANSHPLTRNHSPIVMNTFSSDRCLWRHAVSSRLARVLLATALLVIGAAPPASAEPIITWTGASSANWSNSGNWSGGTPSTYGELLFNGSVQTTNTDDVSYSEQELLWNSSSNWTLNQASSAVISLYDYGGIQSKVENDGSGTVTINVPITFAMTVNTNPWGEISAVGNSITFGSGATLTVNGSAVNGIKFWGGGNTVTFNNTINASGKWFGETATGAVVTINGTATTGDFYVMNGGILNIGAGGSLTTSAVRLGGDFGNTTNQNQTLGGTLALTSGTGGQTFSSIIDSVSGNSSNALYLKSLNISGTNTVSGNVFLDSSLSVQNSNNGTLLFNGSNFDLKQQALTVSGSGTTIVSAPLTTDFATGGSLVKSGPGTLILQGTNNNYTGTLGASLNANGTQIGGGVLGIYADTSLGLAPSGVYNNIQFIGSGTLQDTFSNITLSNLRNISVASGATATFDSDGNAFTIQGVVNGSGGAVAKAGAGTLTLTGSNTYTGATSVTAGAMVVTGSLNGTASASVSAGAILEVDGMLNTSPTTTVGGTLQGAGSVGGIIANGGMIDPGLAAGNSFSGRLTAAGAVTLSSTTNFNIRLGTLASGTDCDQLAETGNNAVTLSGSLNLTLGTGMANLTSANVNNLYYVIVNGGTNGGTISGAFAGLANGAQINMNGYSFDIYYAGTANSSAGGNDVVLKLAAIPEPDTLAFILSGLGALIGIRRLKRKAPSA